MISRVLVKFVKLKRCYTFKQKIEDFDVKQDVKNFYAAMRTRDRKSFIREEVLY